MKNLELTDEQYKHLVKMTFIGEWILNAQSPTPIFTDEVECANYLYSKCEEFGLLNWFNQFDTEWELKEQYVLGILPVIEEYTDVIFWQNLVERLSARDALDHIDNNEDSDEVEDVDYLEEKYSKKYINEFENNNIANLRICEFKDEGKE